MWGGGGYEYPGGYGQYPTGYPGAPGYGVPMPGYGAPTYLPDPGYGAPPAGSFAAGYGAPPASYGGYAQPPMTGYPPVTSQPSTYPQPNYPTPTQPAPAQPPAPATPPAPAPAASLAAPNYPPPNETAASLLGSITSSSPAAPPPAQRPPPPVPLESASSGLAAASFLFSGNDTWSAAPPSIDDGPSSWQPPVRTDSYGQLPVPVAPTTQPASSSSSELDFLERFRLIGRQDTATAPPVSASSAVFQQPTPAAAVQPTPAAAVQPTPAAAVQPTPTAAVQPTTTAVRPTPSAAVQPTAGQQPHEVDQKVAAAEARLAELERRERQQLAELERREYEFGQKQQQFLQRQQTFHEEKEREMRRIRDMQAEFEQKLSSLREREEQQRLQQEAESRILHEELTQQREQLDMERQRLMRETQSTTAQRQQQQMEYEAFRQAKANLDAQAQDIDRQRRQLAQTEQSAAQMQVMQAELERRAQAMQQEAARLASEERRLRQEAQAEQARRQEFARWQEQEMQRQMEEVRLQAELLQKHQIEEQRTLAEELRLQREQLVQQQMMLKQKEQAIADQAAQREQQIQQAIKQFQAERSQHEAALQQREQQVQQRQTQLQQEAAQLERSKTQDAQAMQRLSALQKELQQQQQAIEQERAAIEAKGASLRTQLDANQAQTAQARHDLERLQAEVQGRQTLLQWEEKKHAAPPLPPRDTPARPLPARPAPARPPGVEASADEKHASAVRVQRTFRFWRSHRVLVRWWRLVDAYRRDDSSRALRNRYRVTRELYTTEVSYIANLQIVINVYRRAMVERLERSPGSLVVRKDELATLFGPIDSVLQFAMALESALEKALKTWPLPAPRPDESFFGVLLNMAPHLKLYSAYFNNFPAAQLLLDKLTKDKASAAFLQECSQAARSSLDLPSLLIQPCQRPPRYELLLREVLKHTPNDHAEFALVSQAHAAFQQVNQSINAAKAHAESMTKMVALSKDIAGLPAGKFFAADRVLLRESFGQVSATKKSHSGSFQLFLFSDGILAVSKRSEVQKAFGALPYAYSWHILFTADTKFNELPSVENMFRITCGDPDSVADFALYTFSMEDAPAWIGELKQIVTSGRQSVRRQSFLQQPGQASTSAHALPSPPGLLLSQ